MSSEDVETHTDYDLTHALLKPIPDIPLTTLGNKQTEALKQLAGIFNMTTTPQDLPPPNAGPQEQKNPTHI